MDFINLLKSYWMLIGTFQILENDLQNIIICGLVLFLGVLLKRMVTLRLSGFFFRFVKQRAQDVPVQEFVQLIKTPVEAFIILLVIYIAFSFLDYPAFWHLASPPKVGIKLIVQNMYGIMFFVFFCWIMLRLIDFFGVVMLKTAVDSENKLQEQLIPFIKQLIKMVICILFLFAILGVVFKLNVGAIIAGLGIGGIAVALAGKETLENLLASFTIFIDKPFVAGDLIKIDNIIGNVEQVGFRTTRIRTLDKSLISLPNKQLIDHPLENLSFRDIFRERFALGLPYSTNKEEIEAVKAGILHILNTNPLTTHEDTMVFLDKFGSYTFDLSIIFYVKTSEFETYWKVKEHVNLEILYLLQSLHINLDYPTSVVQLKKG